MEKSNNTIEQQAEAASRDINHDAAKSEPTVPEWKPGKGFYSVFAALLVLVIMVSLDSTSITVALPTIANELHGTTLETFWTGTSFLLTSAVFMLPSTTLSHVFGRMYTILGCILLFLIGIIIASVAQDFTVLILGRTIQGIGGGGITLLLDVIVTDLVPLRERGAYFGIVGAAYAVGTVSGPVIGGALSSRATWRWLFWINIPFACIGLILVPIFLRLKRTPGSISEKLKRLDWVGMFLCVGAFTTFLIPLSWGGIQFPWGSASTIVPLVIGVVAMFGFIAFEWFVPSEPLIRMHLFKSYNMWYSIFAASLHNLITYGGLYFLPLYYEGVKRYSPIIAGVGLLPVTVAVAPMSIGAGIFITKTGGFRPVVWAGWLITVLAFGILMLLDVDTEVVQWVFITLVSGIGLGLLFTSLNFVNMADADEKSMAHAVGLFMFARAVGQSIGVAICGSIFQNQIKDILGRSDIAALAENAAAYSQDAQSLVLTINAMPDGAEKSALIAAYAAALKPVWATLCGLAGIGLIGSFFMKHRDLNRAHDADQALVEKVATEDATGL